jgi:phosphoenolpyruvate-protein phosphotransferase (PTS system enzyme I)
MEILKGIAVSPGVIIGPALVIEAEDYRIPRCVVSDAQCQTEIHRVRSAFTDATEELSHLQVQQGDLWDKKVKDIFAVHLNFLRDRTLRKQITDLVQQQHYTAEYAVSTIFRDIAKHFAQAQDAYISERVSDIYDIERRLIRHLIGRQKEDLSHLTEPVIVVAHDLSPTQTASFDKRFIKAMATDLGGRTSHTAIVARSMGIPAVVALGELTSSAAAGVTVIVDGNRGTVIIDPDEETTEEYRNVAARFLQHEQELDEQAKLPAETTDGHRIAIHGNIEFPYEADITLAKGGEGIGLYRTEFLFLDADHEPTEEDHYQAYMQTLRKFGDHPITIRTIDLGADKFTQSKRAAPEPNPFLGLRSIRYCLKNLPMFKSQIRAILRASVHGKVKMMFPLITTLLELRQAKWIVADVKEDLEEQGIEYNDDIAIGCMIETPAAALIAEHLADEVEFFSIGTNDLIQYTLAVDRINKEVAPMYSPAHPAVLHLIRHIVKIANRAKIEVSVCGEMASEIEYIPLLLGMGVPTLSLAPPMIPEIKKFVRSLSMERCRRIARKALTFDTDKQILNYLRSEIQNMEAEH